MSDTDIGVNDDLLLDEETRLTLSELCRACNIHAEWIIELVDEGIIDPIHLDNNLQFPGNSVRRIQVIRHLQRDLNVNLAGAALALELLDEISRLRSRLSILELD